MFDSAVSRSKYSVGKGWQPGFGPREEIIERIVFPRPSGYQTTSLLSGGRRTQRIHSTGNLVRSVSDSGKPTHPVPPLCRLVRLHPARCDDRSHQSFAEEGGDDCKVCGAASPGRSLRKIPLHDAFDGIPLGRWSRTRCRAVFDGLWSKNGMPSTRVLT